MHPRDHLRGAWPAAHPRPVRQARRQGRRMMGGQSTYLPIEGQRRWRHPDHLRLPRCCISRRSSPSSSRPSVGFTAVRQARISTGWLNWVLSVAPDRGLCVLLHLDGVQSRRRPPTTCASRVASFRACVLVLPRRITSRTCIDHVTLPGGIFMAIIAVVPTIIFWFTGNSLDPGVRRNVHPHHGRRCNGHACSSLESQLKMHNYDGFFK